MQVSQLYTQILGKCIVEGKLHTIALKIRFFVGKKQLIAETYLKEKAALLKVLTKGEPALISWAQATVVNGLSVIEHNRVQESLKKMEEKV